jgi:signal peptidase I
MIDLGPQDSPAKPTRLRLNADSKLKRFKRNPVVSFLIDVFVVVAAALLLSLLIKTFLIRSFYIPSTSMVNTLQVDDRIIVNELVPNVIPLQRGDVVVFSDPGCWLSCASEAGAQNAQNANRHSLWTQVVDFVLSSFGVPVLDTQQHLVKRVIGVGGDHVVCCDANHKITINGVPITEPYLLKGVQPSNSTFNVTVPKDSFWVMGDNRSGSADSRFHQELPSKGFVNKKFVVGRAFVVSWPFAHWKYLDNYPDVFKNIPNY